MDSKTKKLAVFVSLGIILLIVVTVILVNFSDIMQMLHPSAEAGTQEKTGPVIGEDGRIEGADLDAFLQDDTFFDHENQFEEYQKTTEEETDSVSVDSIPVSMLVTSVEKDIRVTVVDEGSVPVEGEAFQVVLNGEEEYTDEDRDGMIHIVGLKAGEYQVALASAEGYVVPEDSVTITVQESVLYAPIADISYLIKTEDEIDAAIEDAGVAEIDEDDQDDTEYTDIFSSTESIQMGIDVSKWNKEIDWELVKAEGIDYAIIRCGYRGSSTGALVEDPYFAQNLQNAKRAGVKVGIYFFTQAVNAVEAVEEASMALTLVNGLELDYPIFIDTEGVGGNGRANSISKEQRTEVCDAFCRTVENAGYKAGIYASRNWYYNNLNMEELDDYYIWLAEYRETPLYDGHYEMWQYSSNGHIEGIETRVDLDISYREEY